MGVEQKQGVELRQIRSLEAYQEIFPDTVEANQILQLSRGPFNFSMCFVRLGDLTLEWNRLNVRCRIRERYVGDGLVLGFPSRSGSIVLEGCPIEKHSVLVWSSPAALDYTTAPDTSGLVVTLSGALLERLGLQQPSSPSVAVPAQSSSRVVDACRAATIALQVPGNVPFERARVAVERDRVLSALLPIVQAWNETDGHLKNTARWSLIRKSEALMRDSGQQLSIDSMAEKLEVPKRTLFHAFRTTLGVGPYRFDQIIRLHRLRRALFDNAADSTRVTDLAIEHGFNHLGRLSADYRAFFGESPSKTLARSR